MKSTHKIIFGNSNNMKDVSDNSVDLIVTSPPYPMIEMWDEIFSQMNAEIETALNEKNGATAFELMHKEMDKIWKEVDRILKPNSIACINIGDATRKIGEDFCLYSNHSRITSTFIRLGYMCLPHILWRKQTNAPNKFMGSGMLPPGAYVTLEHEFILIFRKGGKREFKTDEDKNIRQQSAFFWEERNIWFSDLWDLKGTAQKLNDKTLRDRSAAYPFDLAYRLINMFSAKNDLVLDPFLGTGTTTLAALASQRNSIGIEIDANFSEGIEKRIINSKNVLNDYIVNRIQKHLDFVRDREKVGKEIKYQNIAHKFPVMTKQEVNLALNNIKSIKKIEDNIFEATHLDEIDQSSRYDNKSGLDRFLNKEES